MKEIQFTQLNMHRAIGAATILSQQQISRPSICLLTEPCTAFNKVSQVPTSHASVPGVPLTERPRAAIWFPKNIPFVALDQLSNEDCAVAIVDSSRGKFILASIYLDYNKPVVQDWLEKLMQFIENKRYPALLAFDCNAHSELFGPETNERGKDFEEFIMEHNLCVENRGDTPTFHAFRRGANIDSFIDVTLTLRMIPLMNWRVHDTDFNGSDHHTITWSIPLEIPDRPKVRPWSKANWAVFNKEVSEYKFDIPEVMNTRKIDKLLKRWYSVINKALDKACPMREAKLSPAEMDWYGSEQKYLKNRAKRKYIAHRRSGCSKMRKAFVRAKRAYNKACRKGRREAWRLFIEKTPNESNMSVLFKIAQNRDRRSINTLQKADGTLTDPGRETIQMLTDTHFPAAVEGTTPYKHDPTHTALTKDIEMEHEWIDIDLVRKAMRQFKPNKAPGPDNLKPLVFKYLPQNALEVITFIYQACVTLGHTPKAWRETKVIFLPKPGKPSYGIPKAYRPISLSNFLLKTLERLVVWKMDKDMEDHPIHAMQHGFTKGKCTDSAISNTANYIEEFLFAKQHCLGVFLDISSAFDSISIDHIRQTMLEHNGTPKMVEWYYSYLGRRYLQVDLHGESAHLTTSTGFPQGGVCSARFWLIAFDEAIRIINSNGITGNGYADDCSALIGGTHPHNMIDQMQTVLDRLVTWGRTCGLHFNSQKTVVVMFTRATRSFDREVRMDGQLIPYSKSVVYLGVTMDAELKWHTHIDNKIKKAKGLIMKLASITNSYWGPKPALMKWAYTGIVRPMISYAALSWGHTAEIEQVEEALRRVNRLALCTIVKVPRSTPTRAMEIIMDVMPLHLHILKEGLKTFLRLKYELRLLWTGIYPNLTYAVSHLRYWEWIAEDLGDGDFRAEVDDCWIMKPELKFTLDTSSFVDRDGSKAPANCNVYTDGSKKDKKVGAGVYIIKDNMTRAEESFRLPDFATVYQAEVLAILKAAEILRSIPDLSTIKVYVDSQAALRTIQTDFVKSKLAYRMLLALNRVKHDSLVFVWTKAHVGTEGNEKADLLAKEGTVKEDITDVPLPTCETKNVIDRSVRSLWQKE